MTYKVPCGAYIEQDRYCKDGDLCRGCAEVSRLRLPNDDVYSQQLKNIADWCGELVADKERLFDECVLWQKYAEHLLGCTCSDHMDCGRIFYRSDWPCSCGLRELSDKAAGRE